MLKILSLIIIVNLILSLDILSNNANSSENKRCYQFTSYQNTDDYPEVIDITIHNSGKWFRRVLKAIGKARVDKKYKKYQKAKLIVTFKNNLKCEYLAEIRIHGATKVHVRDKDLYPSLRIKIIEGHINFISNFALIREGAVSFDDEIFTSTLFEELNFLSPLNIETKVSINSNIIKNYLFVEMPSLEMAKDHNRNNGLFIAGNKNNMAEKKVSDDWGLSIWQLSRSINLNRIKNSDGISYKNKNNLLYALDKINYVYLNSLGIGNGKECCDFSKTNKSKSLIEKNYNEGTHFLNFSSLQDNVEFAKISIFNLLMTATNSHHGLMLEDRSFYYDPTFDRFEPLYRDGNSDITSQQSELNLKYLQVSELEKKYINSTKEIMQDIDIISFKNKLNSRGLNIDEVKIIEIINRIINNLETIKQTKSHKNFPSKYAANYFDKHFDKNLKFNLVFGGINKNFEICNVSLNECIKKNLTDTEFYNLLDNKFVLLDGFKKKSLYVRLSKKMYLYNLMPINRSIESNYSKRKLEDNFFIYYNTDDKNIIINNVSNEILLIQKNEDTRFIFIGENNIPWSMDFQGINKNESIAYKRNEKMIGGCVTFLNSRISEISIKMNNSKCPNALEILKSNGSFRNIEINNSALDAFDSEFSEITVQNIIVKKTMGGECIGVKRGNYNFLNANLSYCHDKAVSSGEHSKTVLHNVEVSNSSMGITAKDSSEIKVYKYYNKESGGCLHSYRFKKNYNSAAIFVNKKNLFCDGGKIENDKFSLIEYF